MIGAAAGELGQTYLERPPAPALAGVLSSVWVQRVAPGAPPYTHRTVPNGSIELRCRIGEEARLSGPQTGPVVDVLAPGATVIGVRFRPGAAGLGVAASELVDLEIAAGELWGRPAAELGERIAGTATVADALALLEAHVARSLERAPASDPLVAEAVSRLMPWRAPDVGSLPAALHISERQLRRRSLSAIGLAPKALHRMLRFQGFLALVQSAIAQGRAPTDDGLARLAAEADYADQPHLNRECTRLTGVSPGVFLGQTEQTCACGHDHAASFSPMLRSHPSSGSAARRAGRGLSEPEAPSARAA
jgi:AraC-like DNA-binding protein